MSKQTKRIVGVIGAEVGFDWIKLEFEGYEITIDQLKIYNQPFRAQANLIDQQAQEIKRLRNYLETLRSNTPYGLYQQQITEVLQDAQEYPCTCGNCDGEHYGMALGRIET